MRFVSVGSYSTCTLFLVLISLFNHKVSAQGASFGATGGMNLSSVNLDAATYMPGYQVGGFAKLMITKKFGLQTEALYTSQNSKMGNEQVSLKYFTVPVLVRYNLNSFLNLQVGPQYNMLLESIDPSESLNGQLKHKEISLAVGIGLDMPMGFSASLRFINALNKVNDATGDISSDAVQMSISFALLDFKNH